MEDYDEFGNVITVRKHITKSHNGSQHSEIPLNSVVVDKQKSKLVNLISNPLLMRNVCFVGQTNHGKTLFIDNLIEVSLKIPCLDHISGKFTRYTDTRADERTKNMSVKATPISLVLEDLNDISHLINIMDVPGHPDFSDELTSAMRLADGVVLVVDAAEGVLVNTRRAITHAVHEDLPIVVVINKVDRLISGFRMTPTEAYKHLKQVISSINDQITAVGGGNHVNPLTNNICFASAACGFSFTLYSFAKINVAKFRLTCDALEFASHLWGDFYYDVDKKAFLREPPAVGGERCFVQFILEPLYRLHTQVLENDQVNLKETLLQFGVRLPAACFTFKYPVGVNSFRPLMRLACSSVFGKVTGFIDMLVHHIPCGKEAASRKVNRIYTGPKKSLIYKSMSNCDKSGPLMVNITKLYPNLDYSDCYAFGRVYSGVIRRGQTVCVLNEDFLEDEDDMCENKVTKIWLYQARHKIPIFEAFPGSMVLIQGVSASIRKSATLGVFGNKEAASIFNPLQFDTLSVLKVVVEPLNITEFPQMVAVLREICKSFPLATVKKSRYYGGTEILGPGELFLNTVMFDLERYSNLEIKILHYAVSYRETVVESSEKIFADIENKLTIAMVAEPLNESLLEDTENGFINFSWSKKKLKKIFQTKYGWDLTATSIWAFGPHEDPNILLDCTLLADVDKTMLNSVKNQIVRSVCSAMQNGPLCDEPIRQVQFNIIDASFAPMSSHALYSPSVYHLVHSTLLQATPRLMEPVFHVEIQTPAKFLPTIKMILSHRRGYITANEERQTTMARLVKAFLPAGGLFGFEDDLLHHTRNNAIACCVFDHWALVPSHPKSVVGRGCSSDQSPIHF